MLREQIPVHGLCYLAAVESAAPTILPGFTFGGHGIMWNNSGKNWPIKQTSKSSGSGMTLHTYVMMVVMQ